MEKKDIASFFDNCAPWWDSDIIRKEKIIAAILDNGGIREGIDVLDVACGTGVLFPDYLSRKAASVTAIDLSAEMVKIAQNKFPEVNVICGDVENTEFDRKFDAVMVYNAFPHFPDPVNLIRVLAKLVKPGGRLSVAHGMSRAALQSHHAGRASRVSIDLIHEQELADIFMPYFDVDVVISNEEMYQVSGVRRDADLEVQVQPQSLRGTPMEEMLALMKYMVSHNDAHAQELAELAGQLQEAGKDHAYRKLMDAVADFDMVNAKLDAIYKELSSEAV